MLLQKCNFLEKEDEEQITQGTRFAVTALLLKPQEE